MDKNIELITPFALALAEAVHAKTERLRILQDVRRHQRDETAESLSVSQMAYVSAKRRMREALAVYDRARNKVNAGKQPDGLDEKTRAWLRMYGWNI